MANPFSGVISSSFKTMYTNAIDSLLENTALTVPCSLYYDTEKYETCALCVRKDLGDVGGVPFSPGGSNIFPNVQNCPVCGGTGKRRVEVTPTTQYLLVIFDYKQWLIINSMQERHISNIKDTVKTPEGYVQILSKAALTDDLMRAKYIIIDTNLVAYAKHRFVKDGEPSPLGIGNNAYTLSMWKREA